MNAYLKKLITGLFYLALISLSCNKSEPVRNNSYPANPLPPVFPGPSDNCDTRPVINATLVPIGQLSSPRVSMQCAAAANKIVIIGGTPSGLNWWEGPLSVEIFDIVSRTSITNIIAPDSSIATNYRYGTGIASIGNKVFIAGGGDFFGDYQSSRVDIYDAITDTWSMAQLSAPRLGVAVAAAGDKILFAGGFGHPFGASGFYNTVDIYDNSSNTWSTATLSEGRTDITAAAGGNKIFFAGGSKKNGDVSKTIDIYDVATNTWSVSSMQIPRIGMAGIAADTSLFLAGGSYSLSNTELIIHDNVEILNASTGNKSLNCLLGRRFFTAVKKDDNIIFFTGYTKNDDPGNGTDFEIYNTTLKTWSTGRLSQKIFGAAVVSVNNKIYIAGGTDGTNHFDTVWELIF